MFFNRVASIFLRKPMCTGVSILTDCMDLAHLTRTSINNFQKCPFSKKCESDLGSSDKEVNPCDFYMKIVEKITSGRAAANQKKIDDEKLQAYKSKCMAENQKKLAKHMQEMKKNDNNVMQCIENSMKAECEQIAQQQLCDEKELENQNAEIAKEKKVRMLLTLCDKKEAERQKTTKDDARKESSKKIILRDKSKNAKKEQKKSIQQNKMKKEVKRMENKMELKEPTPKKVTEKLQNNKSKEKVMKIEMEPTQKKTTEKLQDNTPEVQLLKKEMEPKEPNRKKTAKKMQNSKSKKQMMKKEMESKKPSQKKTSEKLSNDKSGKEKKDPIGKVCIYLQTYNLEKEPVYKSDNPKDTYILRLQNCMKNKWSHICVDWNKLSKSEKKKLSRSHKCLETNIAYICTVKVLKDMCEGEVARKKIRERKARGEK